MANHNTHKKNKTIKGASRTSAQGKNIRNDSNIRSVYANVFNVNGNREEIVLLFGINQVLNAAQKETQVQLSNRITLSPFTAKHLAMLLSNALHDYESKYGPLGAESSSATGSDLGPSIRPPLSKMEGTAEKTDLFFQVTKDLNVEIGMERSFKIFKKAVLTNRFLLGFKKNRIREKPNERIMSICTRINMPEDLLDAFGRHLPDADYIHFGFEENEKTCVYKAYLEFYEKIEKEIKTRPNGSDHFLMHLGFKWDASDNNKQNLTSYTWYPFLSVENTVGKLSNILDSDRRRTPLEFVKGILSIASQRIPYHDILYLEVTEEDNPRKSFDINIYRANLKISEFYPLLLEIFRFYSIPPAQFHSLYESVKHQIFGHIAGGIDREGRDFLTIYYGVEYIKDFEAINCLPGNEEPIRIEAGRATSPRENSHFRRAEKTDEKAGILFQLVNSLNIQVGFERSFKIFQDTILSDRFLMGFKRRNIIQEPNKSIVNICQQIGMPEDFLDTFQKYLPESNIVLFGFEGDKGNRLYKAYLEFGHRITEVIKENPDKPEPFLIHMAFKWDASDNSKKTTARYTCFPLFTVDNILERLLNVFYSKNKKSPFDIAEKIITLGLSRADEYEFLYFEAEEENNPRRSFDINMYRANLRLKEIYPLLLEVCRHYSIPPEIFHGLYEPVKSQIFGHLSGGVEREGRDFLTVYFGEKGSTR